MPLFVAIRRRLPIAVVLVSAGVGPALAGQHEVEVVTPLTPAECNALLRREAVGETLTPDEALRYFYCMVPQQPGLEGIPPLVTWQPPVVLPQSFEWDGEPLTNDPNS